MWRILKLDNGKYIARNIFFFLGSGYLDPSNGHRWSFWDYAKDCCQVKTEQEARDAITRFTGKNKAVKRGYRVTECIKP